MQKLINLIKKYLTPITIFLVISFFSVIYLLNIFKDTVGFDVPIVHVIENKLYDGKLVMRGTRPIQDTDVAILTVDDESLDKVGRWPWPRSYIAKIIYILKDLGAKTVVFDAIFPEEDLNSSLKDLTELATELKGIQKKNSDIEKIEKSILEKKDLADTDKIFADSINYFQEKNENQVLLAFTTASDENKKNQKYYKILEKSSFKNQVQNLGYNENSHVLKQTELGFFNIEILSNVARNSAFFDLTPETDGVVRKVPTFNIIKGEFYAGQGIQAAASFLDDKICAKIGPQGLLQLNLCSAQNVSIPAGFEGSLYVNYYGPKSAIPTYSIFELFDESKPTIKEQRVTSKDGTVANKDISKTEAFKDKLVFWGFTAKGLYDLRTTPMNADYPGIEVHATVAHNILMNDFLKRKPVFFIYELLLIVVGGIIFATALSYLPAILGFLFTVLFIVSMFYIDYYFFFLKGLIIFLGIPLLEFVFLYVFITVFRFVTEEIERKKVKSTFSRYVSSTVVDMVLKDPSKLKLGGEKKTMTAVFSDIRGFSTFSEKMDAQTLSQFLNTYLSEMSEIIFKNYGTLNKYIGDAIVAFWGAPIDQENHAKLACKAAIEQIHRLEILNRDVLLPKFGFDIKIGIGLNSGEMSVGNMGSNIIFDYTVLGDNVNLASRLEGINKFYGTNIIISENTYELVKNDFKVRELDSITVKGKYKPVTIYQLFGDEKYEEQKEVIAHFGEGLKLYRASEFHKAIECFTKATEINPKDAPSLEFLIRCDYFIKHPPVSENGQPWDGVWKMKEK